MANEKLFKTSNFIDLKVFLWYFIISKKQKYKIGGKCMLNEQIRKKREELNKSIEEKRDYEYIYRISVELDELIAKYYKLDGTKSTVA